MEAFSVELTVKKLMFSSLTLIVLTFRVLKLPSDAKRYPVLIVEAFSVELTVKKLIFSLLILKVLTVRVLKLAADAKRYPVLIELTFNSPVISVISVSIYKVLALIVKSCGPNGGG